MKMSELPFDAQNVASDIVGDIKYICKNYGKRFSCSQGEKDAADFLAAKLSEGTSDVRVQPFKTHPQAYYGWTIFTTTCTLLAFASYFFSSLVSILLLIVAAVPYFAEYVLFKRLYDPLFKQEESQNVYAVKHCEGDVKRRIVFVSHYDAGNEWHTKYVFGTTLFVAHRALNIIGCAYVLALDIARWALVGGIGSSIASGPMLYAGLAGIFFVISWAATYFFISKNRIIDSANDGLSAAVTATYAFNSLKDVQFENTEVCVLLTGSGSVGMRGAMAFADAHRQEFGEETVFVVASIFREKQYLRVNTKEMNGFVKSDGDAAKLVTEIAGEIGVDCHPHTPVFSNTESGVLSRAGLRSVGINAVSKQMPDYYHTRYDSFENLSEDCIAVGYKLAIAMIGKYSEEHNFQLSESAKGESEPAKDEGAKPAESKTSDEISSVEGNE